MSFGFGDSARKFIETEPVGRDGDKGEQKVWEAVKDTFTKRECMGYWLYPIFSKTGENRKEPDILIVYKEEGITEIEVKSFSINQISSINGHRWELNNSKHNSPYKQAETQIYAILGYCNREEIIRNQVKSRAIVALPSITEAQWQAKGFDRLPNCPPIIFKEHLGKASLLKRIQQTTSLTPGKSLNSEQWEMLLAVIGGTPVFRKPLRELEPSVHSTQTRSGVLNILRERLYELDAQQVHIGTSIPPGAQRMRGIAGSGKTVLLCQKAAHMHLKHPNWDIALVFFTRSLYNQIEELVDKWMRHFSCGEVEYKGNRQAQSKLRILHAWGANNREGFYRTLCRKHGCQPLTVGNTDYKQPNEGLADVCSNLLEDVEIEPMFDAVLIDEGQDLVVDAEELKYEDNQPIYWLAYQSLRQCDPQHPEQRRLIWAYDEAQSLDTLKIPSAPQLFGSNPELKRLVTGTHKGGIKKSEIMHRCYRTPGAILSSAHAIGMGLMRTEGMLQGLTRADDWRAIGYKVEGSFQKTNSIINLYRPLKNSPNPIPDLWAEEVIKFQTYDSRQEELTALAENIKYNIQKDGLMPSREILVIALGSTYEAMNLESYIGEFLMSQGINIFIASGTMLNQLKPKYPDNNPDLFWYPQGVTVSRIHRAKGNEADMVYVVGADNIAKYESNITLRNQLFVALTRSRGWVNITGVGNYPMYSELKQVINNCTQVSEYVNEDNITEKCIKLSFTYFGRPKRDMDSEENS